MARQRATWKNTLRNRFRTWGTPQYFVLVLAIAYVRARDNSPEDKDVAVQNYLRCCELVGAWG